MLDTGFRRHDWVVSTLLRPNMHEPAARPSSRRRCRPTRAATWASCASSRACRKSVSPYYALNITDRRIPLTSVVETTHVVDPEHVAEPPHLRAALRPARTRRTSSATSAEITREYLGHVATMFEDFSPDDVIASQVARARIAEPVHRVGVSPRLPDLIPAPGLVMASSAHVYPDIVHGQAILGVAERVAEELRRQVSHPTHQTTQRSAA